MGRCVSSRSLLPAVAALLALAAPAAARESIDEIRDCMQANLPERTSRQRIALTARDRAGGTRTLDARLHWKRFGEGRPRVRIRVDAPPDLRGASYLLIEKERGGASEMFMYLPSVQRVRRVTARMVSDQLWGTDFSYDDIRQVQWIAGEGEHERLPDADVAGRPAYVLVLRPAPGEPSTYRRIVSFVDRETCLGLKTEFYERADTPRKVLTADPSHFSREGERWMARSLEMSDLRDGTTSWLRVVEVENDVDIEDRVFNPSFLDRGH